MSGSRLVLGLAVLLVGCQTNAPWPVVETPAAPAAPLLVDAGQLMADVTALADDAYEGRRAGTEGGYRAADYVERRFREVGLEGAFEGQFRQPVVLPQGGEGVNVVGQISGTVFPQQALLVTAHFDHLGVRAGQVYNGADDNASGVATLLAVAEAFRADPPEHTVVVAALDAEEMGLVGAQALAEAPPVPLGAVLAVVNLDMVSRGPLWVAGVAHYPHLGALLRDAGLDLRFGHDTGQGTDNWTGASDHAVFHRLGVPFVYFGVEDHADYHEPTDDAARIDPATFGRAADAILRAARVLDGSHAELVAGR
ncbi:M20/M25/M40 family metallo-hydrolase [Rubrivirga marina]|uniref:Peptidase M28 domain-containing protein n=1 Tax=Rubrivirga marina TaxID=1196024 RepID=A0A271IZU5_9BACT|nr:M20/M25/M40 family metallo-hydrolase [Rubrivirga marina]PAP76766.1 hypothetical protein BSZ37_10135 [Rubrivirga marina]